MAHFHDAADFVRGGREHDAEGLLVRLGRVARPLRARMIVEIGALGRDVVFAHDVDEVRPRRLQVCGRGVVFGRVRRGERGGGGGGGSVGAEGAEVVACQGREEDDCMLSVVTDRPGRKWVMGEKRTKCDGGIPPAAALAALFGEAALVRSFALQALRSAFI